MVGVNFDWTEERVEHLRRRRADGASSVTIAGELGCSKNAVLGAAHRLGLAVALRGNNKPSPSPREAKVVPKKIRALIGKPVHHEVVLLDEVVGAAPERGVPLWDLRLRHCRWVEASGPPWVFCGAPKARGSYCEEHARRVFYRA